MNDNDRDPLDDLLVPSPVLFVLTGVVVMIVLAVLVALGWI